MPVAIEQIRPEPARFWVRWAPRGWRGPRAPFVDLARGRLAADGLRGGGSPRAVPLAPLDTVYLPPARGGAEGRRDRWLARARDAGHPVLAQVLAGDEAPSGAALVVVDPTAALLAGDVQRLQRAPAGSVAVWPLLPGLTDGEELLAAGCQRLRAAGARAVQAMVPDLTPGQRRELSRAGGEHLYQALFHGPPPSPLPLARLALAHGLEPWAPRPALATPGRRARNRELAAHLATLAEWRLLLGHPEGGAQALFRAARWVDDESRDVAAVATEGNLQVVDWLDESCRREIDRYAAGEAAAAVAELVAELRATG